MNNLNKEFKKGQRNYPETMTGEYVMILELQPTRMFQVGGVYSDRMHFANVDGGDGGGAPS